MNDRDWSLEPCRGLGSLLLGMERRPLLQRLTELQIAMDADDSDPACAELVDADVMLTFDDAKPHRLRQIEVTDNRIRSAELSLFGRRLHEVLDARHSLERYRVAAGRQALFKCNR